MTSHHHAYDVLHRSSQWELVNSVPTDLAVEEYAEYSKAIEIPSHGLCLMSHKVVPQPYILLVYLFAVF